MPPDTPRCSLVAMPWQAVDSPSLPLGLLRSSCAREGLAIPDTYHGSLRWADMLWEKVGHSPREYTEVAEQGYAYALGEWVFSGVLHGDADFGADLWQRHLSTLGWEHQKLWAMREIAPEFVDLAVREILAMNPEVVGFTTNFMQNVPSLAVAQELSRRSPETVVVFGGGNCEGPMGPALHRNYGFVDLVLTGEAEQSFPALLRAMAGDGSLAAIPGLCRRAGGEQRCTPPSTAPLPPAAMVTPDFDDWFAAFDESEVGSFLDPVLVLESSRGCWWGERHQCTFCGLNGSTMQFRAKSPTRFVDELADQVRKHQTLDVIMVDNIVDSQYLTSALPAIAEQDWDLRLHYEVKANLTAEQIMTLRDAGVTHIQPGIESLCTRVLKIMDKGVHSTHNVRALRDSRSAGLTVAWNWLYGFPGETVEDYLPVLAQLPSLVHLQPPAEPNRIMLERFSPYFDRPELGFPQRCPASIYSYVYDLPAEELADLVYLFDTDAAGLTGEEVDRLREGVETWQEHCATSSLERLARESAIVLRDRRYGFEHTDHVIEHPEEIAAYLALEKGRTVAGVRRILREEDIHWTSERAAEFLNWLTERGLVFTDDHRSVTLATVATRTGSRE